LFVDPARLKGHFLNSFPDGFMSFVGADVKSVFEELKQKVSPDLIFTHNRRDAHQDHRLIAELTWNTFRDHLILEYEIPKYDGDMGQPSVFVPLEMEVCQKKVRYIMEAFQFAALFPRRGQPAEAPGRLALVTVRSSWKRFRIVRQRMRCGRGLTGDTRLAWN
jgi:hypothetical protein